MSSSNAAVQRLCNGPIIVPDMDGRMGDNINGPSLVRAPSWLDQPLGRYYLYFADHKGTYIRLAAADELCGPWRMHEPGSLDLAQSHFPTTFAEVPGHRYPHVASPDVHVDEAAREVRMYYHGQMPDVPQVTRVAVSSDGLHFKAREEILANPYLRMLPPAATGLDAWYGMAMPGVLYRSDDGLGGFERGPQLFGDDTRHCALLVRDGTLWVVWTRVGDAPERLLLTPIPMEGDWRGWEAGEERELLRPEEPWEGAGLPLEPSIRGFIPVPVNQLRDPGVFEEDGRTYLIYSVEGERGLGLAQLDLAGLELS